MNKKEKFYKHFFWRRIGAPTDTFIAVARFETADKTVVASPYISALLNFLPYPFCLPLEGKMPLAADEV